LLKSWLNPKWRIAVFLFAINAAWILAAWSHLDREAWLWITPFALSVNALLLTYDQVLKFKPLEGRALEGADPWGLLKIVNDLAAKHHVHPPKIFVIEQPSAQVFAYAVTSRRGRLFITEGAIKLLTRPELLTVLTYQMLAIRGSQHILNYWMAALLDLFYRAGKAVEKGFSLVFGWSPPLAAYLISPWLGILHLFLISRRDYQRLDRETAQATGHPEVLARALWKMESYAQTRRWDDAWTFAHMCMISPLPHGRVLGLFHIQPNLKNRIQSLIGRYPL
jgi:heat shock protein HtpX